MSFERRRKNVIDLNDVERFFCSFDELSRFLSVFDSDEYCVSINDLKNFSNDLLFDDFRFFSNSKCLIRIFLND